VSQSVEASASADAALNDSGSNGEKRRSRSEGAILFNELVLAHFRWFVLHARYGELGGLPVTLAPPEWRPNQQPREEDRKEAEHCYHEKLEQFTDLEGEVVAAYWSATVPSGIVMTEKHRRWKLLDLLLGPKISLHRATTWLTASDPSIAELLHHCDTLGNKAALILARTSKRVAMTWIFSTESYLLGIVEGRSWGPIPAPIETDGRRELKALGVSPASTGETAQTPPDGSTEGSGGELTEDDLVSRGRAEIIEIEKYYDRAAGNAARFLYFLGMVAGILLAAVAAVLIALIAGYSFDVIENSVSTRFFFACYTAGALGAIVSVLTRMRSESFPLDYEVGRSPALWLGAMRPFIGAVFGLFIYFALRSELLALQEPNEGKAFFFFTFLAFLAGFSERLTRVLVSNAERTVAGTLEEADKALPETSTTTQRRDGSVTTTTRKTSR
jgi:hypothetical protein